MRTDQAFVLLLILLLPLTGCIDTIGEVDAQDSNTGESNNPDLVLVYLEEGQSQTLYVNDTLIKVHSSSFTEYANVPEATYIRTSEGVMMTVDVNCSGLFSMRVQASFGHFLPTIPGTMCEITFTNIDSSDNGRYAGPMTLVFEEMSASRL